MSGKSTASSNLAENGEHLPQGLGNSDREPHGIFERHSNEGVNGSINPVQNKIKNDYRCIKCQSTISNPTNSPDQPGIPSTCERCDQIAYHSSDYKKRNDLSKRQIPINSSARKKDIINEKVNVLQNEFATCSENLQNLKALMVHLQNSLRPISEECSTVRNDFQQQSNTITALGSNQDALQQELLSLKQKLEDLHYATYDGSLIWKIDNCTEKIQHAISGQTTSIYSPAFYSSTFGYKMRARLDLYGDGDARGTHMSIFLVICKGNFDPILSWPFHFPVNFCLFDQTGEENHIVDSFDPHLTSVSFQQPTSDQNIPSGILKFCPWDAFQQQKQRYVQQDKMFIKISLDFFDTPRSILAQTLSINPALPSLEQEAVRYQMIQEHKKAEARLIAAINQASQEVAKSIVIPAPLPITASGRGKRKSFAANAECVTCEEIQQKDRTKKKK